ncbi:hypothetical protein FCG67_14125 [Rhodococcus oryzae]|uniref:PASTA domain-containing protein n=1 Tax=Rhodococcus oryzae TaxID=2571143 RepID=A0ABY2RIF1_9NOCA|nr:PASTA domain-containing protein [Rhodococcus oryzae]TJZ76994.1 hypothetical protein FCG67_14125 [Rhodococcus oryzae]
MKQIAPYLRVLAGLFAAICTWLAIVELINGDFGQLVVQLLFAAGLWYLALGKPIRDHLARVKVEQSGLAARAQAGHEAFLAGDPAAFGPPPEAPKPPPVRKGVIVASGIAALLVVVGIVSDIGDGLDNESDSAPTSAMNEPASAAARQAETAGRATMSAQPVPVAPVVAPSVESTTQAAPAAAPVVAVMPSVVCMNLQAAQDMIQAAGVFFSRSQDASGKGRAQVLDRNWVVVAQTPPAGSTVTEGEAVLSVVKEGEVGDCS